MKREVSMPAAVAAFACVAAVVAALYYFVYMKPPAPRMDVNTMMENMSKPKPPQPFVPRHTGP